MATLGWRIAPKVIARQKRVRPIRQGNHRIEGGCINGWEKTPLQQKEARGTP
jgi:hypothetical protein